MYERNAIVLERYFDKLFGYDMKYNIKTNFIEFEELVKCLEKYKDVSEDEENVMQEYDSIANRIRDIQRIQDGLSKKMNRLQEERNGIFQNIDDNVTAVQNKVENINDSIDSINKEIKNNTESFINIIREFSEKTETRQSCGRSRRTVENEYNKKLNKILDDYQEIDINCEKKAKQFAEIDTENIEEELKQKMKKNGENEKIPFNLDVITKSICLSVDIQKRETEILASIYERTNRLFNEIKNNTVRLDKHKRAIKDANAKLDFISAIKEYLVQFLDNERLTAVNGEEEHSKLMSEACKNLDEDLIQINNLYTLLLKEISKKITKKSYTDLYKLEYLKELEDKASEFDKKIKKLNISVTIINPNYWRIEGMKKIYNVFDKCVTEEYGRDLSEFMIENIIENDYEEEEKEEEIVPNIIEKEDKRSKKTDLEIKDEKSAKRKKENVKAELDKKIDMILGFDNGILNKEKTGKDDYIDEDEEDDDDDEFGFRWDNIEDDEEDEVDEWDEDDETDSYEDEDEEIINSWDEDNEWEDSNVKLDWKDDEEDEEYEEETDKEDEEIVSNEKKQKKSDDDWGNEFIKMDKKGKHNKKKKSFFDKFKK